MKQIHQLDELENKSRYRENIKKLFENKGLKIHEAEAFPDNIHMLVSIPPKMMVSSFMGYSE